jgi:four helix bundle protein
VLPRSNKQLPTKTTKQPMQTFRFLDWKVYKDSQILFTNILDIVKNLPKEHRFDIGNQCIRSALSVPLNIAEGSGKYSDREFNRFIEISLGSLYETVACVDTMHRNKFIDDVAFDKVKHQSFEIANQLGGFKKKLTT